MNRFINRHFGKIIYLLYFFCELFVLKQGVGEGLFPPPGVGTDQLGMLTGACTVLNGSLPEGGYQYSYFYTAFLALLMAVCRGHLVMMRVLQAAVAAWTPVLIYRSARLMKLGRSTAQIAAFFYFFYAPGLLISLDFLRASLLGLAFICLVYFILLGWRSGRCGWFAVAGVTAAMCILGRETFLVVVVAPLLFYWSPEVRKRLGWKTLACYGVGGVVPVLGVMVFNEVVYGSFQPIPNNVDIIMRFYHGNDAVGNLGTALISMFRRIPVQACNFLSMYEVPNSLSVYAHTELIPFLRIFLMPFNILAALAFVGTWYFRRNRLVLMVFLLVCTFAGSLSFFEIFYRFRIPVMPLIAILAGAGVMALYRWWRRREYRVLALSLLFMTVFIALTWVNPDSRRTFNERAAVSRLLIENKHYAKAEDYLWRMAGDGYAEQIRPGVILLVQRLLADGERARAEEVAGRFQRISQ